MIERQASEKPIFLEAVAIASPEGRASYLNAACGDDRRLREEVESLLRAFDRPQRLLDSPGTLPTAACEPLHEQAGSLVGPYKLLEPIGEGGMGTVFMARQQEPVRRTVALKLIKPGMDSKQVIARFEAERQALALMDHPSIAKVHDAGTTEGGRPFFVMELVKGVPITEYCTRERLGLRERLELFTLVCRAVQHAHQKGVIHRDLKPANVLVTMVDGVAMPKVIDFGVAKAMGQSLTDRTVYTALHQLVGTPLYMSPEQASLSGADVDTRSDVYSLGVLLYELLTGTTPFDRERFQSAAFDEICRILREEEPPTPSSRVGTLDAATGPAPRPIDWLVRRLRGLQPEHELDWIVMRSLEKDRNRRYETAGAFATDVRRYLDDEAVEARPPSIRYRFGKFARRNRTMLGSALAITVALIVGTSVSIWQSIVAHEAAGKAKESAREANQRAEETKQIIDYLTQNLILKAAQGNRSMTLGQLFDQVGTTLEAEFQDQPQVAASIYLAMSDAEAWLLNFGKAEAFTARALEIRRRLFGPNHPATLEARHKHAGILAGDAWDVTNDRRRRRAEASETIYRDVLIARRRVLGPNHPDTILTQVMLAQTVNNLGRHQEAEGLALEALKLSLGSHGPASEPAVASRFALAWVAYRRGDVRRAIDEMRQVVADCGRLYGPTHYYTTNGLKDLADFYRAAGHFDESIRIHLEAIGRCHRGLGFTHPRTIVNYIHLFLFLRDNRSYAMIRDLWQRWVRDLLAIPIPADPYLRNRRAITLRSLLFTLMSLPDDVPVELGLAERAAREAIDLDPDSENGTVAMACVLASAGRREEARALVESRAEETGEDPGPWNDAVWGMVGRSAVSERHAVSVLVMEEVVRTHPDEGSYWNTLGVARCRAGDWPGAVEALERSREVNRDRHLAHDGFFLAMAYWRLGHTEEALTWYNESEDWMEKHLPKDWGLIDFRAEAAALLGVTDLPVDVSARPPDREPSTQLTVGRPCNLPTPGGQAALGRRSARGTSPVWCRGISRRTQHSAPGRRFV